MRKIALPVKNHKLCLSFAGCSAFLIYTVQGGEILVRNLIKSRVGEGSVPFLLAKKGVTDVLVYFIEPYIIQKFNKYKINVFVGVRSADPDELVKEFIEGMLETRDVLTKV